MNEIIHISPALASLQEELTGWRSKLLLTATKQPKPLLANALIALRKALEWQGVLAYDEFALLTVMLKSPPWRKHEHNSWTPQPWSDRDDTLTANWLQHVDIAVTVNVAAMAADAVAKDNSFHPIKDYLGHLTWDRQQRVAQFATTHLGAEASDYHRSISQCLFIAGVARIMQSGCKADYVPILEGAQDKGKSSAIEALFTPWFSDDLAEFGTKDAAMQARVAWGIEIAELTSMTRSEIERVKAFVTRKVDRFRPSYGRRVVEVPRQSIFVGSTNQDVYLKDETGGRRFWPIRCGSIDVDAIKRDRDQLWAEAVALYKSGTPWWLTDTTTIEMAREQQSDRFVEDPWQGTIAEYVTNKTDTSIREILNLALMIERAKWTQIDHNRVARCLTRLGWERYRTPRPSREWHYRYLDDKSLNEEVPGL